MATTPKQSYANHPYRPVATIVAGLFALLGVVFAVVAAVNGVALSVTLSLLSLSFAIITLVIMSRTYTVRLQNRIVRIEMMLRLERLGRGTAFRELTMPQIAALRFASDAELSLLLDRTLAEDLTSDQIKRAITDWQGDYFRT